MGNMNQKIMNLILFVHQDSLKEGAVLKRIVDQRFKTVEVSIVQTFNAFKARLKQVSIYDKEIFILLADSKDRLSQLSRLIDLMEDKRILLILPDDSSPVVSMAHQFFPRFFTYVNDTYDDLCAVLTKMINQEKIILTREEIEDGRVG
jgi:hypothetical protein